MVLGHLFFLLVGRPISVCVVMAIWMARSWWPWTSGCEAKRCTWGSQFSRSLQGSRAADILRAVPLGCHAHLSLAPPSPPLPTFPCANPPCSYLMSARS